MRPIQVDYRQFRMSKLKDKEFYHLNYLFGWLGYFLLYFLTENLIPMENCHVIHIWLDDVVPFCEFFVIPYVFWYFLIVYSLVYFALFNTKGFKELMSFIIVTQVVAMAVYIIFPNRQDLRPEVFERSNICTWIVSLLYTADTSSNVCPSLHVAYSIGIMSAFLKEKEAHWMNKTFVTVTCLLVCVSVAFVKQHSVADIFAALPLCLLAEIIAYGKSYWKPKIQSLRA